jgi:basic membrane protein A
MQGTSTTRRGLTSTEDVATSVIAKSWTNAHRTGGFKEGYAELARFGPAVDEVARSRAQELMATIASGEREVFAGPIRDNTGKERVSKGQALSVEQILSFDWMVGGVSAPAAK